jgi:hypothetical protein
MFSRSNNRRLSWLLLGCVSLTLVFGSGMHSLLSPDAGCGCCPTSAPTEVATGQDQCHDHVCVCHGTEFGSSEITSGIGAVPSDPTAAVNGFHTECSVCRFLAMVHSTVVSLPETVSPLLDARAAILPEQSLSVSRYLGIFGPRGPPNFV